MADRGDADKRGPVKTAGSFFTTLPGIMTGVAALLTAVIGFLAFLRTADGNGSDEELRLWVDRLNESCQAYRERIGNIQLEQTPEGEFDYGRFYEDYSGAIDGLVEDVTDDPAPEGQEETVTVIVRTWREASDQLASAAFVDTEPERFSRERAAQQALNRGGSIAGRMGAAACEDLG
jgi:hypothetical protein